MCRKTPMYATLCVAGLVVGLFGCASTKAAFIYTPLMQVHESANKRPEEIEIHVTSKPDRPYDELGIITKKIWSTSPDEMLVMGVFRSAAADIGADAIIMLDSRTGSAANSYTKTTYSYTDFRAMVIRYRDEDSTTTPSQ